MIPEFAVNGNLPPGVHWATWPEFTARFGLTTHRQRLIRGLRLALEALRQAGCRTIYIDGSFVTSKEAPGDFDACWVEDGIDFELLKFIEPTLLDFANMRAAQKAKYGGELFPATSIAGVEGRFLEFFQTDKEGNPKGIVALDLGSLAND